MSLNSLDPFKKWIKIVGNYQLVKYNILIGYLVKNSLLIITKKSPLIFSQTHRAIWNKSVIHIGPYSTISAKISAHCISACPPGFESLTASLYTAPYFIQNYPYFQHISTKISPKKGCQQKFYQNHNSIPVFW